jgi:uncharacterized membrane protein YphA (DoxX/SURF4 family)
MVVSDLGKQLAPLPLRLICAAALIHAALWLPAAGLPAPALWLLAGAEAVVGLALLWGACVRPLALLTLAAVLAAMLKAAAAPAGGGGLAPWPLVPDAETGVVLAAVLLSLLIGGAGALSLDAVRSADRGQALTVLARVRPGQEEALARVLAAIDDNLDDNPYVRFAADTRSHFARWVILRDLENGPRLLFVTTYNGDLASYLEELVRASPGLDAIWGHCEGYTGKAGFPCFVRRHGYCTLAPFYAFQHETVESIRAKIAVRRTLEGFLDLPEVSRYLDRPGVVPLLDALSSLAAPRPLAVLWRRVRAAVGAALGAIRRAVVGAVLWAAERIGALLDAWHFSRVPAGCGDPRPQRAAMRHQAALEAFDNRPGRIQNQLTLYVKVKPWRLQWLRLVLFGATFVNRYGFPPGNNAGVFTIHDLHWVLLDGGKRAVFMSNYDGSMLNYIGDFRDLWSTGLDIFMNNAVGYPPGGIRQTWAFTAWLLQHQALCQAYYSAYPRESVINIIYDCDITSGLTAHYDRGQWERWLQLL